ncbi:TauD/TfdA family dioxygenase [Colwellia sp. MB02u-9]|uniref:TauD/TfdA family dioxygenase n=1 Tax=Colwellia sp. MB02u-9 TaxID=2759823 RepID=UPI0015F534E5|nr:TauD/TfdA family dioxygenase [Colwellia sp. MB02u-9]MBA6295039.1 TauD/TfdA family dioxygenase [Colwellia sp. MB02u-9]
MTNIILATTNTALNELEVVNQAKQKLNNNGWVLLRGFDASLPKFSELLKQFCHELTFDPAREFADKSSQKVNAGIDAVGLHIENGNTPFPPNLVAFYSEKSAKQGSQTTLCDGAELYQNMSAQLQQAWQQTVTVSRRLPSHLWRQYVVNQHPEVNGLAEVTEKHLADFIAINQHQRGKINPDDSLDYALDIQPCLPIKGLANQEAEKGTFTEESQTEQFAFANALLGPSFNYEKPNYSFANGQPVSEALMKQTAELAEKYTQEIQWQDGDIVIINNKRVLHGRRAITGNLSDRALFIGMGY